MMELSYLKILYFIRENSGFISLKQLINIYDSLYGAYDIRPFNELSKEKYITLLDNNNNDITDLINKIAHEDIRQMIDNDKIFIKLTSKLSDIQSLLGFSLKDTIRKLENPSLITTIPVFGKADSINVDVFVIMPFRDNFDYLYHNYIQKVCNNFNLTCLRGDDLYTSRSIMQDVWSLIYNSKIIVADCSGKNPNVMYELGIAHTLGKNVILLTQDINDIPFDLQHLRYIQYEYAPQSIDQIKEKLLDAFYQIFIDNNDLCTPAIEEFLLNRFKSSSDIKIWNLPIADID